MEMIKIAVVQQDASPGMVDENRAKALKFASEALDNKAEIILFHEELIVGYTPKVHELAETVDGPTTQAFKKLLKTKNSQSLIIWGLTEKAADGFYISSPVVSAQGVVANYRKTHLWANLDGPPYGLRHEPKFYKAGDKLSTFEYKGYRCGLMICFDGDYLEMHRSYANLGCAMLFWMNNRTERSYKSSKDAPNRNSIITAVSCCCGIDEKGTHCPGSSHISNEKGKLLAEIRNSEGIIYAEVDPDKALSLRKENPWFKNQRPELYV